MSDSRAPNRPTIDDDRVAARLAEYAEGLEAGLEPDKDAILADFPELRDQLLECFDALSFVFAATSPLRPSVDDAPGVEAPDDHVDGHAMPKELGDFRILRELGSGGMGVVYEAEEKSLGRKVALKVLPFAAMLDPRQLERFRNEARSAASLEHPNIVSVYSVGFDRGVHYYTMELVQGRNLSCVVQELSKANGAGEKDQSADQLATLSSQRAASRQEYFRSVARIGAEAAEALHYAHRMGVIHRDIKPSNLMLGVDGRLFITDFGLALSQGGSGVTVTGDVLGTLRYMSPEQSCGDRGTVDHRTDVYALGVTLYELATLRPAFESDDRQALVRQVELGGPLRPRKIDPSIPIDLEAILLKATYREPSDRYGSAQELAEDLRRFTERRPIQARRTSTLVRVASWSKRNPIQATLLTTCLLLLIVLAIVGSLTSLHLSRLTRDLTTNKQIQQRQIYDLEMRRAQQSLAEGDYDAAVRLLGNQVDPLDTREELIGFEWHYLWNRAKPLATAPVAKHWLNLSAVANSADGTTFAYGSWSREVEVCDAATGNTESVIVHAHGSTVRDIEFSTDGRVLLSSDDHGYLRLWDRHALKGRVLARDVMLQSIQVGDGRCPFDVLGDQSAIAVVANDRAETSSTIHVWPVVRSEQGWLVDRDEPLLKIEKLPHIRDIAISGDDQLLAAACADGLIRVWKLHGGEFSASLQCRYEYVRALTFLHSDPATIIAYSNSRSEVGAPGEVIRWVLDEPRGTPIDIVFESVTSVAASNNDELAVGGYDGKITIFDSSGSAIVSFQAHSGAVPAMAFSSDGKYLTSASYDRSARVWKRSELGAEQPIAGHAGGTHCLSFGRHDEVVVSGGSDGCVRAWDPLTGDELANCQTDARSVFDVECSPRSDWVAYAGYDWGRYELPSIVGLWNPKTNQKADLYRGHEQTRVVGFSTDGQRLAVQEGGQMGIYDVATRKRAGTASVYASTTTRTAGVTALAWHPHGQLIATGGTWPSQIRLWDCERQLDVLTRETAEDGLPSQLTFSPDGSCLAVGHITGGFLIWTPVEGNWTRCESRRLLGHRAEVTAISFSHDSKRVVTGSRDNAVRLWNLSTGNIVLQFDYHEWTTACLSNRSQLLAIGLSSVAFRGGGNIEVYPGIPDERFRQSPILRGGIPRVNLR